MNFGQQGGNPSLWGAGGPAPSVDEFVDLDNFLDSYLTQLHTDHTNQQGRQGQAAPPGMPQLGGGVGGMVPPGAGQHGLLGGAGGMPAGLGGLLNPSGPGANPLMGMPQHGAPGPQFGGGAGAGHHPLPNAGAMGGGGAFPGLGGGLAGLAGFGGAGTNAAAAPHGLAGGLMGADAFGGAGSLPGGLGGLGGFPGLGMPGTHAAMGAGGMGGLPLGGLGGSGGVAGAPPAAPAARGGTKGGARGGRGGGGRGKGRAKSEAEPSSSPEHHEGSGSDSGSGSEGPEHKSRKKNQAPMDEAERRHLALQEKNRRAQRRFRERQKNKLQDLHKQIEELTTRVSSLQNENAALHSRTSILEKVLDMRNEQIQVMQETKESTAYGAGGEEELMQLQDVGGHLVQLNPEMIKELGSDQIYKIYQMYVKELSTQLAAEPPGQVPLLDGGAASSGNAQGGAGASAGTPGANGAAPGGEVVPSVGGSSPELEKLVKDLSMMIMRLGVIKPLETRKFIVVSRQYLGSSEAEVIELWKNVMKSIDLTEQQKREVVELKRMFLQKIEPIMEERKHLNVQIQANLPHDTFHTKNALTYIKAHEAVIKLRDNLRAEQHVVLEFAIAVFRGVFRPRQMATLLVECYPAVPDALGIASALASELGEPDSPSARQLALQLGGYLETNGGATLGTNYMTLHPSIMAAGGAGAAGGPAVGGAGNVGLPLGAGVPGLLSGGAAGGPGAPHVPGAVGGGASSSSQLAGGALLGQQAAAGGGGAGGGAAEQFAHFMARPGGLGGLYQA